MIDHHPFAYVVVPHDRRISAGIGIEIGDLDVCAAELCLPVAAFDGECFAIPFFQVPAAPAGSSEQAIVIM